MLGPEAGELMAVVQTAMLGRLPYTVLREAILAHPTMEEGSVRTPGLSSGTGDATSGTTTCRPRHGDPIDLTHSEEALRREVAEVAPG
jgi:hypothetical protein